MKKLQLKLDGKEMLSKAQMKQITGGSKLCHFYCCNYDDECSMGTTANYSCTTHQGCQAEGIADGWECSGFNYLAALCI
jgi:Zn-finger protein